MESIASVVACSSLRRSRHRMMLWGGLLATLAACTEDRDSSEVALRDVADPYALAETRLSEVFFLKPTRALEESEAFSLAPLIVQSATRPDDSLERRLFGRASAASGAVRVESSPASVYFSFSTLKLAGRSRRAVTYRWWYPETAERGAVRRQGVRMILSEDGRPTLWEFLDTPGGVRWIVAAQGLEDAARAEFGEPLEGRRFALEGLTADCPEVLVVRVIDPGPVPMGPFVYLGDPEPTPVTLLCRCMPSQFDTLRGDGYYELEPLASLGEDVAAALAEEDDFERLEECLRLPSSF